MTLFNRTRVLRLFVLLWLTFVWVLLWGNVSAANILGGLAVGVVIMVALPLPRIDVEGRVHLRAVVKLISVVLYYSVVSSAQVAWAALRPGPPPITGVLRHRVSIQSDLVLTLLIDALNLVPGTMVLEIDKRRRLLYVHVLDVGTEKSVEQFRRIIGKYEQYFIESFERPSDWKPAPWHRDEYEGNQA
ncbi:Na+/H+ antiporter subunit E [Actinomycetes bacterium M1A6_2h]